jgi:hypothetical protein
MVFHNSGVEVNRIDADLLLTHHAVEMPKLKVKTDLLR